MRILITGNMGYVGPSVIKQLRQTYPEAVLCGFDTGYFANCLTAVHGLSVDLLDQQIMGDIRNMTIDQLNGVDVVVHLAAISNDPMGNLDEKLTLAVNYEATIALAKKAKAAGVKRFVFASSCSVYGSAKDGLVTENSVLNPLTVYATSKALSEKGLLPLADDHFMVTCLRFPTACGMSERLRLDLVLNDFVAAAMSARQIKILSDGSPWRPLINVCDMALAIDWAISRSGDDYLVINAGNEKANYQVKELAHAVTQAITDVEISINPQAVPDKRSYQVGFDRFMQLAPKKYHPQCDLQLTIKELVAGLSAMNFSDSEFRRSSLMRLNCVTELKERGRVDAGLFWVER